MKTNNIAKKKQGAIDFRASIAARIEKKREEEIAKIDEKTWPVSVRLSFKTYTELLAIAEMRDTTPSDCVRIAVAEWTAKVAAA